MRCYTRRHEVADCGPHAIIMKTIATELMRGRVVWRVQQSDTGDSRGFKHAAMFLLFFSVVVRLAENRTHPHMLEIGGFNDDFNQEEVMQFQKGDSNTDDLDATQSHEDLLDF